MEGMRPDSLLPPGSNASLKKSCGIKVLNVEDIETQQEWFYLSVIYAQILENTDWISLFQQVSDTSSAASSPQLPVILNNSSATRIVSRIDSPTMTIAPPPKRIRVPPCPPPPKTDPIPEEKEKEKQRWKKKKRIQICTIL